MYRIFPSFLCFCFLTLPDVAASAQAATHNDPIIVGLDADMSSGSSRSGEAIRRGMVLAIDEINRSGGVLGRPLKIVVRDHRGNPARGIDNIEAFALTENLVAVMGGLHTPVALAELEAIHRGEILYLDPWAAGTPIVANGYSPNYVFRLSVRDEYAGGFLVRKALEKGYRRLGLLLENTGWGRSNARAMKSALKQRGLKPARIEWFLWGTNDMTAALDALMDAGADVIMLVANAPEGSTLVHSLARRPPERRLPVISHWGITGGSFFEQTREDLRDVDLVFLQTYSFLDPLFPARAARVSRAYCASFPGCTSPKDIFAPVGTAHAYDLIHLLALAIDKAGSVDRPAVRKALENLGRYEGLVRDYDPPFSEEKHDALTVQDFRLARYDDDGAIVPVREQ